MSDDLLLCFNCGSSTIKVGLFETGGKRPRALADGSIDFRKTPFRFKMSADAANFDEPLDAKKPDNLSGIAKQSFALLSKQ